MEATIKTCSGCGGDLHEDHLCYIISQGLHISEESEYKALISEPEFHCEHCGRDAHSGSNLCRPVRR